MALLEGNQKSVTTRLCDQQIEDTEESKKVKSVIDLLFPVEFTNLLTTDVPVHSDFMVSQRENSLL